MFSVRLFGVVSGCISKIVGALLRVSLSCYFRLANVFFRTWFNIYLWLIKHRSKLWCRFYFEFSLGLVKDWFKAVFTV